MSPVAIRDDEIGGRPSGMVRAYGAAWAGTGLVAPVGTLPPRRLRMRSTWFRLLTA